MIKVIVLLLLVHLNIFHDYIIIADSAVNIFIIVVLISYIVYINILNYCNYRVFYRIIYSSQVEIF